MNTTIARHFARAVDGVTGILGQAWEAAAPVASGQWIFNRMHDYDDPVTAPIMRDPELYHYGRLTGEALPTNDSDIVDSDNTKIYNHRAREMLGVASFAPLGVAALTAAGGAIAHTLGASDVNMSALAMYGAMAAAVPPLALHAHAATSAATYGLKKLYQAGVHALEDERGNGPLPPQAPPHRTGSAFNM